MAIVYRGRLRAKSGNDIVNLMEVFREKAKIKGGLGYDEDSFTFFELEIVHSVNVPSKCSGLIVNRIGRDEEGSLMPYSFAKVVFEAMNSNFQRHVYLTVSAVDLMTQKEIVVFDGVLKDMNASGAEEIYSPGSGGDEYLPFTAYGSSFLEVRADKVFVPSKETLDIIIGRSYPTSNGPAVYGFRKDDMWKFTFDLKSEDGKAAKIAYRPNMVVKSPFFEYFTHLACLNGGYFYVDDVNRTFSFIYGTDSYESKFEYPNDLIENGRVYVASYRIDESRVYGECTVCGDDYCKESKAFMPSDGKNDEGGDDKPEIVDGSLAMASKKFEGSSDLKSDLIKKSRLEIYVPCYDFKESSEDERLYPGAPEGAEEIANRMLRTAALSRTTLVLKVDPVTITPDASKVTDVAHFIVAPTPGDVFEYKINGSKQTFVVVVVRHEGLPLGEVGELVSSVTVVAQRLDNSTKTADNMTPVADAQYAAAYDDFEKGDLKEVPNKEIPGKDGQAGGVSDGNVEEDQNDGILGEQQTASKKDLAGKEFSTDKDKIKEIAKGPDSDSKSENNKSESGKNISQRSEAKEENKEIEKGSDSSSKSEDNKSDSGSERDVGKSKKRKMIRFNDSSDSDSERDDEEERLKEEYDEAVAKGDFKKAVYLNEDRAKKFGRCEINTHDGYYDAWQDFKAEQRKKEDLAYRDAHDEYEDDKGNRISAEEYDKLQKKKQEDVIAEQQKILEEIDAANKRQKKK